VGPVQVRAEVSIRLGAAVRLAGTRIPEAAHSWEVVLSRRTFTFGTWACSHVLSVISLQMIIFPSGLDLGSPRGEVGRLSAEIAAVMPRIAVLP
jgi:hypothetical protein